MIKQATLTLGILIFILLALNTAISYNYENVNVTTKVNITNARPVITSVIVDQSIQLNAGGTKMVYCNISFYDWNGYNDTLNVNATFYVNGTAPNSADNNNSHYTQSNCTFIAGWDTYYANYSCNFSVYYFANASGWTCNATVSDNYSLTNPNFTDTEWNYTTITAYYAINVTTPIDFGSMAVGDTKNNITANITNFGNMPINISVEGYGASPQDNLAMNCQIGNISVGRLHYSIDGSQAYGAKTALTKDPANITSLTAPKRTDGMIWNTTYWDLYIDPTENPFGVCNGTIVFTASAG